MERNSSKFVSLEDKLKSQNSVFLENCRIGDLGTVYAHRDGEVCALRGTIKDIGVMPSHRNVRLYVVMELPLFQMSQMAVFNLINGQTDFYTIQ